MPSPRTGHRTSGFGGGGGGGDGLTEEEVEDVVAGLLVAGTNITLTYDDAGNTLTIDAAGGGGGAPTDAQYVTLATNGTLSDERVLTAGEGIDITDGGAGSTVTILGEDASDNNKGIVELAVASEVNTGTDTTRAITPDAFAGSNPGTRIVTILVTDPNGDSLDTLWGSGAEVGVWYYSVPSWLNGMNLVGVEMSVVDDSTSGVIDMDIVNVTQSSAAMLTTGCTIDATEFSSLTAAAAVVIDTANDDVASGDILRGDMVTVGTGALGLIVHLAFRLP